MGERACRMRLACAGDRKRLCYGGSCSQPGVRAMRPPRSEFMTRTVSPHSAPSLSAQRQRKTLQAIALYEGLKGVAALGASIGLLSLLHHDLRRLASELIGHFGLDPERHYPAMLMHYVERINVSDVHSIVVIAFAYAAIRIAEGYGLWHDYAWGEWLGAVSGAIYLPVEIWHQFDRPSWTGAGVFLANLVMVVFLVWRLLRRRNEAAGLMRRAT